MFGRRKFSPFDQAMAEPCPRCSPCRNPPSGGEDELAGSLLGAPTEGSNTPTPAPPVFQAQSPTSTQAPAPLSNKGLF